MDLPKLKNIKIKFPRLARREFRTIGEKANYDWRFILVGFLILALGAVSMSFYLFIKVSKGEIFTVAPENVNSKTEVNAEGLGLVNSHFAEKRLRLEAIRANPPKKTDPSL